MIEKYLQSTHAPTHSDYSMTVLDIFSVDRDGENSNFLSQLHNRLVLLLVLLNSLSFMFVLIDVDENCVSVRPSARTLLWHGSRLSNWVGILSQGLRVAPPEAPVTGYMVGWSMQPRFSHSFS